MHATITDLAQELLEEICALITQSPNRDIRRDLCSLRLACRGLRYPFNSVLFQKISMTQGLLPTMQGESEDELRDTYQNVFHHAKALKIELDFNGLASDALLSLLMGLATVTSVTWIVTEKDSYSRLVSGISSLPRLKALRLRYFPQDTFTLPDSPLLLSFSKIERLTLIGPHYPTALFKQASTLLRDGSLTHLSIDDPIGSTSEFFSFPSFPPPTPDDMRACRLRCLRLNRVFLRLQRRPRIFRGLTHLEARGVHYHGHETIWKTVRQNQLRLKTIVTDRITSWLITYLLTYSGLEHLEYLPQLEPMRTWNGAQPAERHAFYSQVLPLHLESITGLTLSWITPQVWAELKRLHSVVIVWVIVGEWSIRSHLEMSEIGDVEDGILDYQLPSLDAFKIFTKKTFFQPRFHDDGYRWMAEPTIACVDSSSSDDWTRSVMRPRHLVDEE
ncbi:hypothetical protein BKA70DRAFT_1574401 [Coprinopsis sp. MPI-PUGE-AT-0042]|nr:hypothetical protein BKA70DRAFT_1574401 [Coprinopsis sp. MPI-PUGE-AT-0042]